MPFGPEPLGLVYFTGVKLAGYSAFGAYLKKKTGATRPAALTFGAARTALGLAAGVAFASALGAAGMARTELLFFLLLIPVRFAEWLVTIWFFFARGNLLPRLRLGRQAAAGVAWSYLLDIPAIMSVLVLPGGAWIC